MMKSRVASHVKDRISQSVNQVRSIIINKLNVDKKAVVINNVI